MDGQESPSRQSLEASDVLLHRRIVQLFNAMQPTDSLSLVEPMDEQELADFVSSEADFPHDETLDEVERLLRIGDGQVHSTLNRLSAEGLIGSSASELESLLKQNLSEADLRDAN